MRTSNLIHGLTLDVAYEGGEETSESLAEWLRAALLPVVDTALAQQDRAGQVRRIERLEIDLGSVLREEAEGELARRLSEQLASALDWSPEPAGTAAAVAAHATGAAADADAGWRLAREQLLNFLRSGRLPWSVAADQQAAHERLLRQVLAAPRASEVLSEVVQDHDMLVRLVRQFSTDILAEAAAVLHPHRGLPGKGEGETYWRATLQGALPAEPMMSAAPDAVALEQFRDWRQRNAELPSQLAELHQWLIWWLMHDSSMVNQDCSLMLDSIAAQCAEARDPVQFMRLVLSTLRSGGQLDLEEMAQQSATVIPSAPMDAITTLKSQQSIRNFVGQQMKEDARLRNLNSAQLHQLVKAWIGDPSSLFLAAVESHALQSSGAHDYFQQILQSLLNDQAIDLEALGGTTAPVADVVFDANEGTPPNTSAPPLCGPSPLPPLLQQNLPQRLANAMLQADLSALEVFWLEITRHHADVLTAAVHRYLRRPQERAKLIARSSPDMLVAMLKSISPANGQLVEPILRHAERCGAVLSPSLSADELRQRVLNIAFDQAMINEELMLSSLIEALLPKQSKSEDVHDVGHAWQAILPPLRALDRMLFGERYLLAVEQRLQDGDNVSPALHTVLAAELCQHYPELVDSQLLEQLAAEDLVSFEPRAPSGKQAPDAIAISGVTTAATVEASRPDDTSALASQGSAAKDLPIAETAAKAQPEAASREDGGSQGAVVDMRGNGDRFAAVDMEVDAEGAEANVAASTAARNVVPLQGRATRSHAGAKNTRSKSLTNDKATSKEFSAAATITPAGNGGADAATANAGATANAAASATTEAAVTVPVLMEGGGPAGAEEVAAVVAGRGSEGGNSAGTAAAAIVATDEATGVRKDVELIAPVDFAAGIASDAVDHGVAGEAGCVADVRGSDVAASAEARSAAIDAEHDYAGGAVSAAGISSAKRNGAEGRAEVGLGVDVSRAAVGGVPVAAAERPVSSLALKTALEAEGALAVLLMRAEALGRTEQLAAELMLQRILRADGIPLSGALETALSQPSAIDRLVQLAPAPILAQLLVQLQTELAAQLPSALRAVAASVPLASVPAMQSKAHWRIIYQTAFVTADPITPAEFIRSLIRNLGGKADKDLPPVQPTAQSRQAAMQALLQPLVTQQAGTVAKAYDRAQDEPTPFTGESNIRNAGMVIIATYAQRLFSILELTKDGQFISEEAAQRAVHLLQYAITAATTTPEYQLVLNKLLCGIHGGQPITRGIDITDKEKDTIEQMLNGVIAHWKALGKTSIAGLRQTFLQREGHLYFEENAWQLKIPTATFDMLLDRLPWSFAMIKFPWMEHPLHVTWR